MNKLIDTKREYQNKLNEILKKYFIKYFDNLYESEVSYKQIQIKLLKIFEWSSEKKLKEYKKFKKYTKDKFDLSEDDLNKMLEIILGINIKIITSLYDEIDFSVPKFEIFWLKYLKRMGKYYYENPKITLNKVDFKNILDYIIQKCIPLKKIINSTHKELLHYNFDNYSIESIKEVELEKEECINENEINLKYIESDEFENEYYNSDREQEKDNKNETKFEEKHIKLKPVVPKKRKSKIDENLFDNM